MAFPSWKEVLEIEVRNNHLKVCTTESFTMFEDLCGVVSPVIYPLTARSLCETLSPHREDLSAFMARVMRCLYGFGCSGHSFVLKHSKITIKTPRPGVLLVGTLFLDKGIITW